MLPRKRPYAYPVKHGRVRRLSHTFGIDRPVTVCIAAGFKWLYPPNQEGGRAVLTATDRRITYGDSEFDPNQLKICFLSRHTIILVSGNATIHSEAISRIQRQLKAVPESDPSVIAELYAAFIRDIKYRYAVQTYLSPIGLDHESFYAKIKDFSPALAQSLLDQLQNYGPESQETEAIVIGVLEGQTHIYLVDRESKVSCQNDVGFAAIGSGSWHAKSHLMRARYSTVMQFAAASAIVYSAKKISEIAPGVGDKETDMYVITRDGWEPLRPDFKAKLMAVYQDYQATTSTLAINAIKELDNFLPTLPQIPPQQTGSVGPTDQSAASSQTRKAGKKDRKGS